MAEPGNTHLPAPPADAGLGAARNSDDALTRGAGPWLYGALFVVVLPALLALWAASVPGFERMPALHHPVAGALLAAAGTLLWALAVGALVRYGGGLPMNAYPPVRHVRRGPYAYLANPIYAGFALAAAGVVIWTGSRAGLWLVLPVLCLAMSALVLGHEAPVLRARFPATTTRPRIALPPAEDAAPSAWHRFSFYPLVLLPWALGWSAVQLLGVPADARVLELPVDRAIPVLPGTWWLYATPYLLVPALPLLARSRSELRRIAITAWFATGTIVLLWLVLPLAYPPRPFESTSLAGRLLAADRAWCTGMAAFPAFHVVWSLIAAAALARRWPRAKLLWGGWAAAVTASCATTGMHGVLDLAAAVVLFPVFGRYAELWAALRAGAERIANSWREWRLGPVRIINHGGYGALAAAAGVASLLLLAPEQPRAAAVAVAAAAVLGAGAWAQLIESSSGLLRPFGYYGAVFGAAALALAGPLLGFDGLLLLAALSVGAPWVQLLGRLRCLVQGCCHGHVTSPRIGIRYTHERSRVSYLAHLAGQPLHPTPLYSMLANAVLGVLLLRLWLAGAPQALIMALYLVGNGCARFVEEGYRGEPQTPVLHGLRLYQWLAIGFVVGGAVLSVLPSAPAPPVRAVEDPWVYLTIVAFALLTGIALGVDLPESNRRFSRLAG